jgi:hypothetical protein
VVLLAIGVGWLVWPGRTLDPRVVEDAIREAVRFQEGVRQTSELRDRGLAVPDPPMALAWAARWHELDTLRIEAVETRRCWKPAPLSRDRCVIARAKLSAPGATAGATPYRYFRLRPLLGGPVRAVGETGAWAWWVRI